jgi:hypothetical protein
MIAAPLVVAVLIGQGAASVADAKCPNGRLPNDHPSFSISWHAWETFLRQYGGPYNIRIAFIITGRKSATYQLTGSDDKPRTLDGVADFRLVLRQARFYGMMHGCTEAATTTWTRTVYADAVPDDSP